MTSIEDLKKQLQDIRNSAKDDINAARKIFNDTKDITALKESQNKHLGKKSPIAFFNKQMKDLSSEEKRSIGPELQLVRERIEKQSWSALEEARLHLMDLQLSNDWIDVTKDTPLPYGSVHALNQVQRDVEDLFSRMGFYVADGPEVETEWHNFDALNIPPTHPARDMQDTFFVKTGQSDTHENTVLRTHTSNVQIRHLLQHGAPCRIIAPGRVYRNEATDMTHDAQFYQVEGMMVGKDVSLAHLKGTLETLLRGLFEQEDLEVRFRPGYFPFVEPGLEVDIYYRYTDKNGQKKERWIEFCGAGMMHPQVLRAGGVDPEEYSGFAFGFGLSRLVMMKYKIDDLRYLTGVRTEFSKQF